MNAKVEFLEHVKNRKVFCAYIILDEQYNDETTEHIVLAVGYGTEQYEEFLKKLDFVYDDGYGGQYITGNIWYVNSPYWSERGEYDGSEWWEYRTKPRIPDICFSGKEIL